MRASLHPITKLMKSSRVPKVITQQPFDYDPGHYKRLCNLQGRPPGTSDLIDYALDMTYMDLQPELLRHLMPVLLNAWRRDLFEGEAAGLRGFVEHFWPALLKGKTFQILTGGECEAIMHFMRDSILDRLDAEGSLTFSGMRASPYAWVRAVCSYGVLFADIESLWTEWWKAKTRGHAVATFQYASALLYENEKNPVFAPWSPKNGGGPPALWEYDGHIYDVGWKEENLNFLNRTLSVDYVVHTLQMALAQIATEPSKGIATRILADLPDRKNLLALRIEELPQLLANGSRAEGFTV